MLFSPVRLIEENEERIKPNVGLTYKFSLYSCEENCSGKKKISKMTIMPI